MSSVLSPTADPHFDVAIVGLGPVGCLGAILMAAAGLRVAAVEKEPQVYKLPRAVNLDGEIIRALQPVNLATTVDAMMQRIRPGERAGFANSKREWLFGIDAVSVGSHGWQPANMFDQPELEQFLRDQVQQHDNITTYIGYEVTAFTNEADRISINATDNTRDVSIAASYMIACDGANSPTRKALDINWHDLGYDQDWLVVDVTMEKPHSLPNEVLQICDPERIHTYVATKDPFRRWEFQLNPGETADQMLDHQHIQTLLDDWIPRDSYSIRRAAVYQFHAAVADTWRYKRTFLAGDAAHQTPPFLGQGMNTGIRDVINLAWKLPLVLNGTCSEHLLETYQAERDAHAHDLVSWAVSMGQLMQHMAATEAAERAGNLPPQMSTATQTSGYGQGREQPPIRSGAVVERQVSNEGATGYMLSQPTVLDQKGNAIRLDDLIGSGFALVTNGSIAPNAKSLMIIEQLTIKTIDTSPLSIIEGRFTEALSAGETLLVRPDKIVFGHTDRNVSVDHLLAELAEAVTFTEQEI